eukprot:scaffold11596_cov28-Tisochrysis_lutea.AAC.1
MPFRVSSLRDHWARGTAIFRAKTFDETLHLGRPAGIPVSASRELLAWMRGWYAANTPFARTASFPQRTRESSSILSGPSARSHQSSSRWGTPCTTRLRVPAKPEVVILHSARARGSAADAQHRTLCRAMQWAGRPPLPATRVAFRSIIDRGCCCCCRRRAASDGPPRRRLAPSVAAPAFLLVAARVSRATRVAKARLCAVLRRVCLPRKRAWMRVAAAARRSRSESATTHPISSEHRAQPGARPRCDVWRPTPPPLLPVSMPSASNAPLELRRCVSAPCRAALSSRGSALGCVSRHSRAAPP